jgi:FAD/FMN-containing dehydrogenase
MAGLTLGGGYGALNGHSGLAVDTLLGAEVVLADERHVMAGATRYDPSGVISPTPLSLD